MPKTYVINTNQKNDLNCEKEMIKNMMCAAYYSPWKFYIDQLEAHDFVFLYSNKKGIIARGIASGITEIADCNGNVGEQHYMELDRFTKLKIPLPASKITEIVGHDITYNQTVIYLTGNDGINLWQNITKHCI